MKLPLLSLEPPVIPEKHFTPLSSLSVIHAVSPGWWKASFFGWQKSWTKPQTQSKKSFQRGYGQIKNKWYPKQQDFDFLGESSLGFPPKQNCKANALFLAIKAIKGTEKLQKPRRNQWYPQETLRKKRSATRFKQIGLIPSWKCHWNKAQRLTPGFE